MRRIAFKVVTPDLRSLGLRKNPTIVTYPLGCWISSPKKQVQHADAGGIWSAQKLSGARTLVKYMLRNHNLRCRVFRAEIDGVVRENSYRVQSKRIRLLSEIPVLT
jgi:hypothetical protein